jgi:hypothetical protein
MPTYTIDEAMQMSDEELIRRALNEVHRSPENVKLTSILQMRWSMRNQKGAEENAKLTTELVNQTTLMANKTKELARQTRNMAWATFSLAAIGLVGLIIELVKKTG